MKYWIVILSMMATCNLSSEKSPPANYILQISSPDTYHGETASFWYLESTDSPQNLESFDKLTIGDKFFRITHLRITSDADELLFGCKKGDGKYLLKPGADPDYNSLKDKYQNYTDHLYQEAEDCYGNLPANYRFDIKGSDKETYSFYRAQLDGCRCVPYYDRKFSAYTDTLILVRQFLAFENLAKPEKEMFSQDLNKILAQPLIQETLN